MDTLAKVLLVLAILFLWPFLKAWDTVRAVHYNFKHRNREEDPWRF